MHWVDPDYLPETKGTFERFIVNHHGEADGVRGHVLHHEMRDQQPDDDGDEPAHHEPAHDDAAQRGADHVRRHHAPARGGDRDGDPADRS